MKKKLLTDCSMFLKRNFILATLHKVYSIKIYLLAMLVFSLSTFKKSSAQIIADGQEYSVLNTGSFQDLVLPNNPLISKISFSFAGADGGAAILNMGQTFPFIGFETAFTYKSGGGNGAIVNGTFLVGTGPGKIPLGSTVRFIIGQKGVTGTNNISLVTDAGTGSDYGSGGGGTAILYKIPGGTTWTLLGVAGGGGGAYQGVVSPAIPISDDGGAGEESENGANGGGSLDYGPGGISGQGGWSSFGYYGMTPVGGGGGGRFTKGEGFLTYVDIGSGNITGEYQFGEGGAGAPGGSELGGDGGTRESQPVLLFEFRNGGFGYGGGGAGAGTGGGGGGYAGGGGGGLFHGGGGGGSYLNGIRETGNVSGGGSDTEPDDGVAYYQVTLNQPPVAICKNTTVYLSANGQISIVSSNIDNGSNDPDGTPLTYSLSKSSFTCADIGDNNVTLTVTDNYGATSTCTAVVTVVDNTPPAITCPANVNVNAIPGLCYAFVSAAKIGVPVRSDNCSGIITISHSPFPKGNLFPAGTTSIIWTATDAKGNIATCTQTITVKDVQPPLILNLGAIPNTLWPVNNKMRDVKIIYTSFDNCGAVNCVLSVSSNEPVTGPGDNTSPDWEIINDHHVKLRAERSANGNGRTYTITITCTDKWGNIKTSIAKVKVPRTSHHYTATRPGDAAVGKEPTKNEVDGLQVTASPNPTNNHFRIEVKSNNRKDKITMQVFDILGRSIELRNNLQTGTSIMAGGKYKQGAYFIRVMQGNEYKVIKLVKLAD